MTNLNENIGTSNKTYGSGLYHNYHQNIKENIIFISDNYTSKKIVNICNESKIHLIIALKISHLDFRTT